MQFSDNEILFISELLIKILNDDIKQRVKSDIQEILDKSFDTTEIKVTLSKEEESKTDADTVSIDDSKTDSSDDSKSNDDPVKRKRGRPHKKLTKKIIIIEYNFVKIYN